MFIDDVTKKPKMYSYDSQSKKMDSYDSQSHATKLPKRTYDFVMTFRMINMTLVMLFLVGNNVPFLWVFFCLSYTEIHGVPSLRRTMRGCQQELSTTATFPWTTLNVRISTNRKQGIDRLVGEFGPSQSTG